MQNEITYTVVESTPAKYGGTPHYHIVEDSWVEAADLRERVSEYWLEVDGSLLRLDGRLDECGPFGCIKEILDGLTLDEVEAYMSTTGAVRAYYPLESI